MNSTFPFTPTFSNTGWNFGTPFNSYPSYPSFPFFAPWNNGIGTPGTGYGSPFINGTSPNVGGWGNWNNAWNTSGSFPWSNWTNWTNWSNGFGFGTPSNFWGANSTPWNATYATNFFNGFNGFGAFPNSGFTNGNGFPWYQNFQGWTPFAGFPGFYPGFVPAPISQGTTFQGVGGYGPASYPFNGYAGAAQGIRNNGTGTPGVNPQGIREAA